jgi:small subunit ribosomal protein S16
MVRIRLRRVGFRHQPSYRIVAAEKESPRDGRFLEILGQYNPRTEPASVNVDEARLFHWLKNGAQPSEAVFKILKPLGTFERWERYKQGEDLDTLLAEAEESQVESDTRTRRDDLFEERAATKARKTEKEEDTKEETPAEAIAEEAPVEADEEEVEEEAPAEAEAEEAPAEADEEEAEEEAPAEAEAEEAPAEADEEEAEEEAPAEAEAEDKDDEEESGSNEEEEADEAKSKDEDAS